MQGHPHAIEMRILDPRLHDWGLPRHQSELAAAWDLHACLKEPLTVAPGDPAVLVPAGFALLMGQSGMAALILPRSGLGHRKGLVLGNAVGLIDADYMAEIMISVWNRSAPGAAPVTILPGDRIAQMMFVPVLRPVVNIVEDFTRDTARGAGGFGSTGTGA
ncbi:MAG: dUTP diphosphatase [Rubellimicrobium sp.]|nr:dUTP diphosphatase [Rubellimicrobium sp.]